MAIGTGVLGGMITATILVILFVPIFYVLIEKTFGRHRRLQATKSVEANQSGNQDNEEERVSSTGRIGLCAGRVHDGAEIHSTRSSNPWQLAEWTGIPGKWANDPHVGCGAVETTGVLLRREASAGH
jgi:hypothetical protein